MSADFREDFLCTQSCHLLIIFQTALSQEAIKMAAQFHSSFLQVDKFLLAESALNTEIISMGSHFLQFCLIIHHLLGSSLILIKT